MVNGLRTFVMVLIALGVLAGLPARAQSAPSPDAPHYSQDELDQLLAPIALYPDELLAQVLMAATYPLEVVQAARFVEKNPGLKGEALDQALAERNWDPSVQSLAAFPQVLAMMDDKLDWTQRLGDAFLVDQERVMNTVQSLRKRAEASGNLQSTPQQTVVAQDQVIIIQPAQPDVVYVPVYDPLVIYGPWWAPAYPPWYWCPPPIYGYPFCPTIAVGIWFGFGWVVSHDHWGWAHPDWRHHHVALDTRDNRFWNRPGRRPPPGGTWQHSPDHRRGVAYPDPATRDRFIPVDPNAVRAREDFRGRDLVPPAPLAGATRPSAPAVGGTRPAPAAPPPRSTTSVVPPAAVRPVPAAPAAQPRPSPGISRPTQQAPRPIAPPAGPIFDPGVSRQQAQINAQRGLESRRSITPVPPAVSRPPATSRPPAAAPMYRAPAPSAPARAPAPAGGRAPSPPRPR